MPRRAHAVAAPFLDAPSPSARPFLKWAGGKTQLLRELVPRVERAMPFGRYHEPFIGGGALFFELRSRGLDASRACLSDTNPALVEAWVAVRDDVAGLMELLRLHAARHSEPYYYAVRANVPIVATERAARLIYLNKTCYNGLYRENRRGGFNVPIGRYTAPTICDAANLRACSEALQGVGLRQAAFDEVATVVDPGDFVYFDPPYVPFTPTASFTAYAKDGFGDRDQARLACLVDSLSTRGVKVLLSNSMTPRVRTLYGHHRIDTVLANRAVNSRGAARGAVPEALVQNYGCAMDEVQPIAEP